MSLPLQAVDRLFERLVATYGRQFTSLFEGLDTAAVKSAWAHELSGYSDRLSDIAWALEHLPERPPNVIAFRNLCRCAPSPELPRLPVPKADPVRLRAELERLGGLRNDIASVRRRGADRSWAHRIVARHESGETVTPAVLKMARDCIQRERMPVGAP